MAKARQTRFSSSVVVVAAASAVWLEPWSALLQKRTCLDRERNFAANVARWFGSIRTRKDESPDFDKKMYND